ncbi:MAG: hypothetical protein U0271_00330 [Polyangiaceae bacterium]
MRFAFALPIVLATLSLGCDNTATTSGSSSAAKSSSSGAKSSASATKPASAAASQASPRTDAPPVLSASAPATPSSETSAAAGSAAANSAAAGASSGPPPPDKSKIAVDESKIDKTIPDIPSGQSKPPSLDEWMKDGVVVNSQEKNSRADKCEMRVLREWLKIKCEGEVMGIFDLDGFGPEGVDHFKAFEEGKWADIVVRLKEGQSLSTRIPRYAEGDAALFTNWPKGAKKPHIIALGRGGYPTYASCGG